MKTLTALFAATALTLTAGLAQADVRPDQIPSLLQSGAVKPFEQLNKDALGQTPWRRYPRHRAGKTRPVAWSTKLN